MATREPNFPKFCCENYLRLQLYSAILTNLNYINVVSLQRRITGHTFDIHAITENVLIRKVSTM